jgi:hypothetical protein
MSEFRNLIGGERSAAASAISSSGSSTVARRLTTSVTSWHWKKPRPFTT